MSCILRVSGKNFDIDDFLATNTLEVTAVYRRGEPRHRTKPSGAKHLRSGANILVSDADLDSFEQQVTEALDFLAKYQGELQLLHSLPGVEDYWLDFGVKQQNLVVHNYIFPVELLRLCSALGLSLELSQYPLVDEEDEEANHSV